MNSQLTRGTRIQYAHVISCVTCLRHADCGYGWQAEQGLIVTVLGVDQVAARILSSSTCTASAASCRLTWHVPPPPLLVLLLLLLPRSFQHWRCRHQRCAAARKQPSPYMVPCAHGSERELRTRSRVVRWCARSDSRVRSYQRRVFRQAHEADAFLHRQQPPTRWPCVCCWW
jgi:hypothetical protein